MKAITYRAYGSPEVLKLEEVAKPAVGDDDVLVQVQAASVNPFEWHHMRGKPFLVRLSAGLFKPKNPLLGSDVAGQVEAIGRNVKAFQPGDAVFGAAGFGALAEYVRVREDRLVPKPVHISFEEAAAVPIAALTALQGLRGHGQIQAGQKVLINGASGGVGTYAIQLARYFGAEVTGVCSTRNLEMVRSLGADHVIDYTKENFTQQGQQYDLILDNVGNYLVADYKRVLSPQGICVIVGFASPTLPLQVLLLGPWQTRNSDQKIVMMMAKIDQKDLIFMQELLEAGQVKSVLDRCYPLNETAEAIRYLEMGHAQGKVVVTI